MNNFLLKVLNLHKNFIEGDRRLEVLKGISLNIKHHEMLALVGASGAGKSTFLYILGTLEQPSSGYVYYKDKNLFALKEDKLAAFRNQTLGFVFQAHHLLPEFTAL